VNRINRVGLGFLLFSLIITVLRIAEKYLDPGISTDKLIATIVVLSVIGVFFLLLGKD
jgi:hypothetical protein